MQADKMEVQTMAEERQTEYIQVHTPDIMKIGEYVIKAKGVNRTMAQFAEECGIGASTLSRIANGKITKPLSVDVVKAIYEHRDPESKISFDMFMAANGMRDREKHERMTSMRPNYSIREETMNRERQAKNAIVAALLERDVPIMKVPDSMEHRRTDAPYGMNMYFDFAFYIEDAPQQLWYFDVIPYKEDAHNPPRGFIFDRLSSLFAKIFLVDAWVPDYFRNQKTTFVFCDSKIYASVVEQYKEAPINSAITVMLVDTANEKVVEEAWLSGTHKTPGVLDRPVGESDGYIATWLDEDYEDQNNF